MRPSNCSSDAKSVPKLKSFTGREIFISKILEEVFSFIQEPLGITELGAVETVAGILHIN